MALLESSQKMKLKVCDQTAPVAAQPAAPVTSARPRSPDLGSGPRNPAPTAAVIRGYPRLIAVKNKMNHDVLSPGVRPAFFNRTQITQPPNIRKPPKSSQFKLNQAGWPLGSQTSDYEDEDDDGDETGAES